MASYEKKTSNVQRSSAKTQTLGTPGLLRLPYAGSDSVLQRAASVLLGSCAAGSGNELIPGAMAVSALDDLLVAGVAAEDEAGGNNAEGGSLLTPGNGI